MVEVWATPLPEAAPLAVPAPDPDPAELRGESLIIVDTVAEKKIGHLPCSACDKGECIIYLIFLFYLKTKL